jgi:hypothetical protein
MFDWLDKLTNGLDNATGGKAQTKRTTTTGKRSGKVDHAIYPNTPRHRIYMQCSVCIPAPRWLNITGSKGSYNVPWLSQVGIKVLDFDYGAIMSDGSLQPAYRLMDSWNPDPKYRSPYATAQWVEITVRGDNDVPKWAELLCVKYHQGGGKAHYITPRYGMLDPANMRYALNSDGIPMPAQIRQKGCRGPTEK